MPEVAVKLCKAAQTGRFRHFRRLNKEQAVSQQKDGSQNESRCYHSCVQTRQKVDSADRKSGEANRTISKSYSLEYGRKVFGAVALRYAFL
jgi:hypothetical protein